MARVKFVFILTLMAACGRKPAPESKPLKHAELQEQRNVYLEDTRDVEDASGFVHSVGDGLLFTCLRYWSGAGNVTPFDAIRADGRPLRHPLIQPGVSATPFSRDMFVGLLYCMDAADDKRLDEVARSVGGYGRALNWDLCGPAPEYLISATDRLSRCQMTPALVATFYELIARRGLECDAYCQDKRQAWQPPNILTRGFARHLDVLHLALRIRLTGQSTLAQRHMLQKAAEDEPRNALFAAAYAQAVTGDYSQAVLLLTDRRLFPDTAPPSPANYCTEYLWQRDSSMAALITADDNGCVNYVRPDGRRASECDLTPGGSYTRLIQSADWAPCPFVILPHSATDWLTAARFVLGRANNEGE